MKMNSASFQGIMHKSKPVFTAQFHPEAKGGPTDTEVIKEKLRKLKFYVHISALTLRTVSVCACF